MTNFQGEGRNSITYPRIQQPAGRLGIGWLTFTVFCYNTDEREFYFSTILPAYSYYFRDALLETKKPSRGYKDGVLFASGSRLNWSPGRTDISFSINQSVFDSVSMFTAMAFLLEVNSLNHQVTRLDLYLDDFLGIVTPSLVEYWLKNGWYVGRADNYSTMDGFNRATGKHTGEMVSIGKRKSSTYIRFYDKALESKLDYDNTRYEVEYKGKRAQEVFDVLLSGFETDYDSVKRTLRYRPELLQNTIKGLLLGSCSFIDPKSAKRTNDRKIAKEWEQLFMNIEEIKTVNREDSQEMNKVEE